MKERCSPDCPCESSGWRVQTISLTALEEVEINGFEGDNHELDFLKLVLRCAPMLKRMIVKLSDKASASNYRRTKLYNIFRANSSVEFYVYLSSGLMHGSQNCLSTWFSSMHLWTCVVHQQNRSFLRWPTLLPVLGFCFVASTDYLRCCFASVLKLHMWL